MYSDQRSNYCENDRVSTTTSSRTSSKTNNDGKLIMPCNIGGFTTNKKSLLEIWAKLFSTCAKNVPIWRFFTENFFHGAFVSLLCMRVCVNEMWSEKAANSFSLVRFGLNLHISVVALHFYSVFLSFPFQHLLKSCANWNKMMQIHISDGYIHISSAFKLKHLRTKVQQRERNNERPKEKR